MHVCIFLKRLPMYFKIFFVLLELFSVGYIDVVIAMNEKDQRAVNALVEACKKGNAQHIAFWLKTGISINAQDTGGITPLIQACQSGHFDIVKTLLDQHADIDHADQSGMRPLHHAVDKCHSEIVELLLQHKADLQLASLAGKTPFALALKKQLLLKPLPFDFLKKASGRTINQNRNDRLEKTMNILLEYGAFDMASKDEKSKAVVYAALGGDFKRMRFFLEKDASLVNACNKQESSLLHLACRNGNKSAIQFLLDRGACVNAKNVDDDTPLHISGLFTRIKLTVCSFYLVKEQMLRR